MYHDVRTFRRTAIVALALGVMITVGAAKAFAVAGQDPVKCRRTIALWSANFEREKAKRLEKCNDFKQNGKDAPTVAACFNDAFAKIDAKATMVKDQIAKQCCGGNHVCNGADTGNNLDLTPAQIEWDNRVKVCATGARAGTVCTVNNDCPGNCVGGAPPAGVGAECTASSTCGGGICTAGLDCGLPSAGPNYCPNLESGKLPGYTAPIAAPLGTLSTIGCGTCVHGAGDGTTCRDDADCGTACEGGPSDGNSCSVAADCSQFCFDGASQGTACQQRCFGGVNNGQICVGPGAVACGAGIPCGGQFNCGKSCATGTNQGDACVVRCAAGSNNGTPCNSAADCTGGGTCTDSTTDCLAGNACTVTVCATSSCRSGACAPGIKVTSPADAADCAICFGEASVDQVIGLPYDSLNTFEATNPAGHSVAAKLKTCKRAVGMELQKFFDKKRNLLRLCEDKVIHNLIPGPCPDGSVLDPTTTAGKIAKAQASLIAKISDPTTGKCKGFTVSQIGAPVTCPNVTIPGGASCAGPIDTVVQLANCLACVAEYKVDCADAMASTFTSGTNQIPSACNQNCGNGKVDPGETCDDGNVLDGDVCPSDCTISTCSPPFGSQTATISYTPPPGVTDLSAMTIYLQYPDSKVRIPGQGGDISVQNAINVPSGATYTPNDLNYALNILINQPDLSAIDHTTPAFIVTFDTCASAPAPVPGDFRCLLRDGTDTAGNGVFGGSCSVTVP